MNKNILAVLLLVLAGLVYPFFIQDLQIDIAKIKVEVTALEDTIAKVAEFNVTRDQLVEKRNGILTEDLEKLEQIVPQKLDMLGLIVSIQQLALKNSMLMQGTVTVDTAPTVISSEKIPQKPYEEITVGFTAIGSYSSLTKFLSELAQSATILDVTTFDFASSEKEVLASYNVKLKTYRLRTETASP